MELFVRFFERYPWHLIMKNRDCLRIPEIHTAWLSPSFTIGFLHDSKG